LGSQLAEILSQRFTARFKPPRDLPPSASLCLRLFDCQQLNISRKSSALQKRISAQLREVSVTPGAATRRRSAERCLSSKTIGSARSSMLCSSCTCGACMKHCSPLLCHRSMRHMQLATYLMNTSRLQGLLHPQSKNLAIPHHAVSHLLSKNAETRQLHRGASQARLQQPQTKCRQSIVSCSKVLTSSRTQRSRTQCCNSAPPCSPTLSALCWQQRCRHAQTHSASTLACHQNGALMQWRPAGCASSLNLLQQPLHSSCLHAQLEKEHPSPGKEPRDPLRLLNNCMESTQRPLRRDQLHCYPCTLG
jgi:hypothetical protein